MFGKKSLSFKCHMLKVYLLGQNPQGNIIYLIGPIIPRLTMPAVGINCRKESDQILVTKKVGEQERKCNFGFDTPYYIRTKGYA